jgi:Mg2+-importing ATPase
MMSVVVRTPEGGIRLLAKGAPEEIYRRAPISRSTAKSSRWTQLLIDDLKREYEQLSADGFRVLAVAYRDVPDQPVSGAIPRPTNATWSSKATWRSSTRPKRPHAAAIKALHSHGVSVKVLTGDNDLVARKSARKSGSTPGTCCSAPTSRNGR